MEHFHLRIASLMHKNKKRVIAFFNLIVLSFSVSIFSGAVAGIDLVN
jgi:hypothetical protein